MTVAAPLATLVRFGDSASAERRLICVPFAGGGAATYRLWARSLPEDVELLAVQLPGRDPARRMTPPGSVEELVESTLPALGELPELPFALFGHSLGALVAFEVTVALESAGRTGPTHLFVSGRRPPDEVHRTEPVHDLPDDEFLDALHDRYGGVPDVIRGEPELLAMLLPALRADVRAFETYAPLTERKVRCAVHVYGGRHDLRPSPQQLAGWQRVAENARHRARVPR